MTHTILWRGIDKPGHDYCRLVESATGARLSGLTLRSHEQIPAYIGYDVECDVAWHTLRCTVKASVGDEHLDLDIRRRGKHWMMNGMEVKEIEGAADIDLSFTPATNLLPIRRLGLEVGETATVVAALLRFPDFTLEPLDQRYTRLDEFTYHYESGNGAFRADLKVDRAGLVLDYPGQWVAESHASTTSQ